MEVLTSLMAFAQRSAIFALLASATLPAMTVRQSAIGATAQDQGCAITRHTTTFAPSERQVFFWFVAQQVRAGDDLTVEWIDPDGKVAASAKYDSLPTARELCLMTQLPLAGFAPANQPGNWAVRAVGAGGVTLISRTFEIQKNPFSSVLNITTVTRKEVSATETEIQIEGNGFQPGLMVHIAQYTKTGGWNYIAALPSAEVSDKKITLRYVGMLGPGEYMATVRNLDDKLSNPSRIIVATSSGYRMPFAGGETWQISQTPYGSFSHWGTVVNAYDIAPQQGACVVAMRAGIVHAFDRGEVQSPGSRTFGNYVTIDHGDGEYSHYGHLTRGTFVVKSGQRVEAGQALARVGNSGYAFGVHVHAQVTKAFYIGSQSIPFKFVDVPNPVKGMLVKSTQNAALGDCSKRLEGPMVLSQGGSSTAPSVVTVAQRVAFTGPHLIGQVGVGYWWHNTVVVGRGAARLQVRLSFAGQGRELNLHLVSPSGKHYGWYGDKTGYSGQGSNPEEFDLPSPEVGTWRVSVQGTKGTGEVMEFELESQSPLPKPATRLVSAGTGRRGGGRP